MLNISIIIVNYKVAELVERCIDSIYAHTQGVSFEVFLVDNASGDDVVERVSHKHPEVNIIANNENLGFASACNQGIELAQGDFVLLLNPDTELKDDAISAIVSKMRADAEVGIGGVHLINPDGTHQSSGVRRFPKPLDQLLIMLKVPHLISNPSNHPNLLKSYFMYDLDPNQSQDVDQVMGAFFCIKRDLIRQIGPLDRGFFIWFEEVDFCKRAVDAGWRVRYYADIDVIHYRGKSFDQVATIKKQKWIRNSLRRYIKKHFGFGTWFMFAILEPVFVLLAIISQIIKPK
ncbi:MAG: glycosyltransferase family 2 protein [Candidatus Uhrbacteria bacterium]|nr:glycosyltransferase family 2 protein [Patescibacteria group bacterium]MBU1906735.1 glycosyltransferase family 2 protein [Patescibacteria group bacterium]